MKVFWSIIQWIAVIAVFVGLWLLNKYITIPPRGPMPGYQVILFALSLAFLWVEILKWGVTKPFNCIKCMTGWFSLLLAIVFHTPHWYLYLPLGSFVGAMYSGIKMRHL